MPAQIAQRSEQASAGPEAGDTIEPLFFRPGARQLFACYHAPARQRDGARAAVLCPPSGHEYTNCHRAFRALASQLTRAGHHALRFDYFGTGDSAGEYGETSLTQWRQDIEAAVEECKRLSGLETCDVIGLRLGATIGARVAADRSDIGKLILWQPILDGRAALSEWRAMERAVRTALGQTVVADSAEELMGLPMTAEFRAEIGDLDIERFPVPRAATLLAAAHESAAGAAQLFRLLQDKGLHVEQHEGEVGAIWRQEPVEAIVPFQLIRALVTWLGDPPR